MTLPQATALRDTELRVGQRVVYPNQGVCLIAGIETKEIGGQRAEFLTMKREEDGATVMVPRAKLATIGLRHVAQPNEIKAILEYFQEEIGDPELDWKVRHRTHADKMTDGSLSGTAEVLKALHSLAERRPLPQKERELYDSARHLVVNEVAVGLSISRGTGEDMIDFCLTPPAGSARAKVKAKLKADREAAEENELLGLEDAALGDLGDLGDVGAALGAVGAEPEEPEESDEAEEVKPAKAKEAKSKAKAAPAAKAPAKAPKAKPAKAKEAKESPKEPKAAKPKATAAAKPAKAPSKNARGKA